MMSRCLRLVVIVLLLGSIFAEAAMDHIFRQACSTRSPLMDPTHEVRFGQDVIWQIPLNPKAILFLAHGANKDPLSFFDPGPKCELCYGLPEDRMVVLDALRRGYAVIAVKSIGIAFLPWPPETPEDLVIVSSIMKAWTREHDLESLPLAAWGHSAGGTLVAVLSMKLSIRALVLMCSQGKREVTENATPGTYPPSFFAYMPVDMDDVAFNVSSKVTESMMILREKGLEVAEKQCWPKPLSPSFFTERIRCMSNDISEEIYGALKADGWLDDNNYLTKNPNKENWESALGKENALPFCEDTGHLCYALDVQQELQFAYAEHSLTSDANEEIYSWLSTTILSSDQPVTRLAASQ